MCTLSSVSEAGSLGSEIISSNMVFHQKKMSTLDFIFIRRLKVVIITNLGQRQKSA